MRGYRKNSNLSRGSGRHLGPKRHQDPKRDQKNGDIGLAAWRGLWGHVGLMLGQVGPKIDQNFDQNFDQCWDLFLIDLVGILGNILVGFGRQVEGQADQTKLIIWPLVGKLAVLVIPDWPCCAWYKPFHDLITAEAADLPNQPDLFLDPKGNPMSLLAWKHWLFYKA